MHATGRHFAGPLERTPRCSVTSSGLSALLSMGSGFELAGCDRWPHRRVDPCRRHDRHECNFEDLQRILTYPEGRHYSRRSFSNWAAVRSSALNPSKVYPANRGRMQTSVHLDWTAQRVQSAAGTAVASADYLTLPMCMSLAVAIDSTRLR